MKSPKTKVEQVFFQIYLFPFQIYLCISTLRERELGIKLFFTWKIELFRKIFCIKKFQFVFVSESMERKKGRKKERNEAISTNGRKVCPARRVELFARKEMENEWSKIWKGRREKEIHH